MIPRNVLNNDEAKKELDKIKETIKTFGQDIYEGKITIKDADEYQADLLTEIINFRKNTKPRRQEKSEKKKLFFKTCIIFLRVEKKFLMLLKAKYFR